MAQHLGQPWGKCSREKEEREQEGKKEENLKEEKEKEEKERVRVEGSFLAITSATVSCSCRHTKPGAFSQQMAFCTKLNVTMHM